MSPVTRILVVGALLMSCASADKAQPPHPARELAAGGARIRGGGMRMDVQIGRALTPRPAKAGTIVVTPDAVVTP